MGTIFILLGLILILILIFIDDKGAKG